jgi:hypothetical protein
MQITGLKGHIGLASTTAAAHGRRPSGTDRLDAVFQQPEIMARADVRDFLVAAHRTARVDDQNGAGVRANLALEIHGIHAERLIDIRHSPDGAGADNSADAADPHISGNHNFVAGSDAEAGQCNMQGSAATVDGERAAMDERGAPFRFQAIDHAPLIQTVETEWSAGTDDLIDRLPLLFRDPMCAGQFPWQWQVAYGCATLDCEPIWIDDDWSLTRFCFSSIDRPA